MNRKYYHDILESAQINRYNFFVYMPGTLMGESTHLVCVQLKERDFEKRLLQKQIITMQKSVSQGCALCKKVFGRHFGILTFSYMRHFPSFLVLGLILVQTAVLAKENNCMGVRKNLLMKFCQFWQKLTKSCISATLLSAAFVYLFSVLSSL